jgi:hypothetical protein
MSETISRHPSGWSGYRRFSLWSLIVIDASATAATRPRDGG